MAVPAVATKSRRFLFKAGFLSGLAEPAGALLGLFAVHLDPALIPSFMGFAAGAMILVSAFELVPMARRYRNMQLFALGLAASAVVYAVLSLLLPN